MSISSTTTNTAPKIEASIDLVMHTDQVPGGRVIMVGYFENKSTSGETYHISSVNTPLNGNSFLGPTVTVEYEPNDPVNGITELNGYLGSAANSGIKPRKTILSDLVTLEPGKKVEWHFLVSDVADFDKSGSYDITLCCKILNIFVQAKGTKFADAEHATNMPLLLKSNTVTVAIKGTPLQTAQDIVEELASLSLELPVNTLGTKALPPQFVAASTDPVRVAAITAAHYAAYLWLKVAENVFHVDHVITGNKNLEKWFDVDSDSRIVQVLRQSYSKMAQFMETTPIIYDFTHKKTGGDHFAHVTGKGKTWDHKIYLAGRFWQGAKTPISLNKTKPVVMEKTAIIGMDSQAGTIIHELAHGVDQAFDFAGFWYGSEKTQMMAKLNVYAGALHADGLEYFCETSSPFTGRWAGPSGEVFVIEQGDPPNYSGEINQVVADKPSLLATTTMDFSIPDMTFRINCAGSSPTYSGLINADLNQIIWTGAPWASWTKLPPLKTLDDKYPRSKVI